MCRMLGIISAEPISPYKYLVQDECSLLVQAEKGRQDDGWGIGYYVNGELIVFKSPNTVYKERDLFIEKVRQVKSNIIIAHVRKASNPRNLPKERLISLENTQPFSYENYVFAHNGTIYYPDEVLERLGNLRTLVRGVNDSEVYFAYLIKEFIRHHDFVMAVKAVKKGLWEILHNVRVRRYDVPYSSLNVIFSDGRNMYAMTHYVKGENIKAICYKDTPYFNMAFYYDGKMLVVSSERTNNSAGWQVMNNNEILIASIQDGRVKYHIERLE
ncbi:MAG: hypothetical protein DRJ66_05870 [Thermoprotei archaeon]|nr:MAG: hypothetical protein DRJ66_05870 [Thermoprotei archaeon]